MCLPCHIKSSSLLTCPAYMSFHSWQHTCLTPNVSSCISSQHNFWPSVISQYLNTYQKPLAGPAFIAANPRQVKLSLTCLAALCSLPCWPHAAAAYIIAQLWPAFFEKQFACSNNAVLLSRSATVHTQAPLPSFTFSPTALTQLLPVTLLLLICSLACLGCVTKLSQNLLVMIC